MFSPYSCYLWNNVKERLNRGIKNESERTFILKSIEKFENEIDKVQCSLTKIQFEIFETDDVKNIKWVGPETCGVSHGHYVYWTKNKDAHVNADRVIESKDLIFKANSLACLFNECDLRLHDISLDDFKELEEVRFFVHAYEVKSKSKLSCSTMDIIT